MNCASVPKNLANEKSIAIIKTYGNGSLNYNVWGYVKIREKKSGNEIEPYYWNNSFSYFSIDPNIEYLVDTINYTLNNGQRCFVLDAFEYSDTFIGKENNLVFLGTYELKIELKLMSGDKFTLKRKEPDSDINLIKNELIKNDEVRWVVMLDEILPNTIDF
jgi:hypothetical protein